MGSINLTRARFCFALDTHFKMATRDADFLQYKALLFAFPGAVLANTTGTYIRHDAPAGSIVSFVLIFLFIVVEAYSSHLWETVDRLGRNETSLDYIQETFLAFIDLLRISLLTLAIGVFPELNTNHPDVNLFSEFTVLLAVFLLLNFAWNLVARPLETDIRKLFELHYQNVRARGASPIEVGLAIATKLLLRINGFAFFWFFPLLASLTVLYYVFALSFVPYSGALAAIGDLTKNHYVGFFASFLATQIILKLTQVGAIRLALSWDERTSGNSDRAGGGLISQMASENSEVYIVDRNELRLRNTNLKLSSLLLARSRIYHSDRRRNYAEIEQLVFDAVWDRISAHIVYMEEDVILGMIRITPSHEGKLPISEQFDQRFGAHAYELSRMIVDSDHRGNEQGISLIAAKLFVGCAEYLSTRPVDAIVIDAIIGTDCVIKERTYKRLGFASQDQLYRDYRYGADSVVLKTSSAEDIQTFFAWAQRMRRRWVKRPGLPGR